MKDRNKIIAVIAVGIAIIVAAVVAIAIISNNNNNKSNGDNGKDNTNTENTDNNKDNSDTGDRSDDTASNSDANTDPFAIIGKWEFIDPNASEIQFVYKFEEDGSGSYYAAGTDMPFTYSLDGNRISIIYDSGPFETEYEINGDVLNIKDSDGNDTLYKKAG